MRYIPHLVVALGSLQIAAAATLELELEIPKDRYLPGERLLWQYRYKNTGDKSVHVNLDAPVLMYRRADSRDVLVCDDRSLFNRPASEPSTFELPAGQEKAAAFDAKGMCPALEPGGYEFSLQQGFDVQAMSGSGGRIRVASSWRHVVIDVPSGIDGQAFREFGGRPWAHEKELLEKYPTSSYAAAALLKVPSGARRVDTTGSDLLRQFADGPPPGTFQTDGWIFLSSTQAASYFIPRAEAFLEANPQHASATELWLQLGMAYSVERRWQKAHDAVSRFLASPPPTSMTQQKSSFENWHRVLVEYLDELEARGLASAPEGAEKRRVEGSASKREARPKM